MPGAFSAWIYLRALATSAVRVSDFMYKLEGNGLFTTPTLIKTAKSEYICGADMGRGNTAVCKTL